MARETIVIVDGKRYREGPCMVPGCKYLYHRPFGTYLLKLCELHLRRYKARQTYARFKRYVARKRAEREAEQRSRVLETFR